MLQEGRRFSFICPFGAGKAEQSLEGTESRLRVSVIVPRGAHDWTFPLAPKSRGYQWG